MNNQREQNTIEKKIELLKKMGVDEVGSPEAIDLSTVDAGYLHSEYMCTDDGDLVLHFFWKEPPSPHQPSIRRVENGLPAQDNFAAWPTNFREVLWNRLLETFHVEDEPSRVEIEWIPELFSWYSCVKGVSNIMKPPPELIKRMVSGIVSDLSS